MWELFNREHPLYPLAGVINWQVFEEEFGPLYAEGVGRPALPTRLLVGMHYLKHLYYVSDEVVLASWLENPFWKHFYGEEFFWHKLPCAPTSLTKWR
ncbi:MAG: transposase [Acidobacteria bacterium]|nr:transposase [Acidobacteriota bacterium]